MSTGGQLLAGQALHGDGLRARARAAAPATDLAADLGDVAGRGSGGDFLVAVLGLVVLGVVVLVLDEVVVGGVDLVAVLALVGGVGVLVVGVLVVLVLGFWIVEPERVVLVVAARDRHGRTRPRRLLLLPGGGAWRLGAALVASLDRADRPLVFTVGSAHRSSPRVRARRSVRRD
jgi:hypothetical protein